MNIIYYAINNLKHAIPHEILELCFSPQRGVTQVPQWYTYDAAKSVDANIRDKIIEGRVNIDCNLLGGVQIAIDLSKLPYTEYDIYTKIFNIPLEQTGFRKIVSVMHVSYMNDAYGYQSLGYRTNSLLGAAQDLYQAMASMPIVSTANCSLVGENTVMIRDSMTRHSSDLCLSCIVENDEAMANLKPGIYLLYSELVTLATKAYIYNNLSIAMDQGAMTYGYNIGAIRDTVSNYADANELYLTMLRERWQKAAVTNDRARMKRLIDLQTSNWK